MSEAAELDERISNFSKTYFLIDVRNDKEKYLALSKEELNEHWRCYSGIFLNLVMDGELGKATELIESLPATPPWNIIKFGFALVHPKVSMGEFIGIVRHLKEINLPIHSVVLTAGRPFILNGFLDFTRLGCFLERKKDRFIEYLEILYESECVSSIYMLCLAEYKYQQNKLLEAGVIVSQVIKEFDKNQERRLLFTALYLQSKILLVHDKIINTEDFIQNIKSFVKEEGKAEFSYNIDAAQVFFSLYEGNIELVSEWLASSAPNEFTDFNMLDLYRYMVKIRCYIVTENYAAAIALIEKLRPLLEEGNRIMDLCELDLLLSMALYRAEKKSLAFEAFERAIKVVHRRKYYRLVADEGETMLHILIDYVNERNAPECLMKLIEITREIAIAHPLYLKVQFRSGKSFSRTEIDILKLLEQGKSKEEIGEYFFISVNTVKYHLKKIYSKLGVSTAQHAVWEAKIQKII